MWGIEVFGHGLNDEMAGVDCADGTGSNPSLAAVDHERVVGPVAADMRFAERADPNPRSVGDGPALAHSDAFIAGEELLVGVPRLYRFRDHGCFDGPIRNQLHPSGVQFYRFVQKHRFQPRPVLLLKQAHPSVVALVANRVDRLLRILTIDDWTASFLRFDRSELNEFVHPRRPQMLLTAGIVIAEYAGYGQLWFLVLFWGIGTVFLRSLLGLVHHKSDGESNADDANSPDKDRSTPPISH